MTRRIRTSADLLPAGTVDARAESKKVERRQLLRAEWICKQMSTEQGQAFFHELIFSRAMQGVGVCGLNDCNPKVNIYQEGIRGLQASVNDELRRHANPSDYAAMIMRSLGGKPSGEVAEQERRQA